MESADPDSIGPRFFNHLWAEVTARNCHSQAEPFDIDNPCFRQSRSADSWLCLPFRNPYRVDGCATLAKCTKLLYNNSRKVHKGKKGKISKRSKKSSKSWGKGKRQYSQQQKYSEKCQKGLLYKAVPYAYILQGNHRYGYQPKWPGKSTPLCNGKVIETSKNNLGAKRSSRITSTPGRLINLLPGRYCRTYDQSPEGMEYQALENMDSCP
ncbi:hypothetical protein BJ878DRAFT_482097 [Calycina marina]|uniref:Uncharacterized protein n=1 Tax=Calycina marina TaxID=1763456 RepID=A0A9P8CCV1_9HELO|nr:hypothetical protein BJ878DRAFT_482097 [Calycina marina]